MIPVCVDFCYHYTPHHTTVGFMGIIGGCLEGAMMVISSILGAFLAARTVVVVISRAASAVKLFWRGCWRGAGLVIVTCRIVVSTCTAPTCTTLAMD